MRERWVAILVLLAALVTIGTPLFVDWFSFLVDVIYSLVVVLLLVAGALVATWTRLDEARSELSEVRERKDETISELKDEIDERDRYYDLIDEKYTLPIEMKKKRLKVWINEAGDDQIKYTNTLSATEGNNIDKFYALIGTDKTVQWSDLDLNTTGATVSNHYRRDYEDFTRLIVEFDLHELVGPDDSYEISYSVEHDVVDVDDDYAYLIMRHQTEEVNVELIYPDGWEPVRYIASPDEGDDSEELPQPDKDLTDEDSWYVAWSYSSCSLGERYQIDWIANGPDADSDIDTPSGPESDATSTTEVPSESERA